MGVPELLYMATYILQNVGVELFRASGVLARRNVKELGRAV